MERLLHVARQDFDYVVVDAGSRFDSSSKSLFRQGRRFTWCCRSASPNCAMRIV